MSLSLGYRPGCIGRIAELHGTYYSRVAGFGVVFEAKVAAELSAFCLHYREGRDGLWLAMEGETIHGSVAIDGARHDGDGAQLRWFIVSDAMRGNGLGTQLLRAALDFCRACAYRQVNLWTFDELHAARHLYEKHGFALMQSERGAQWGREVNQQRFSLRYG